MEKVSRKCLIIVAALFLLLVAAIICYGNSNTDSATAEPHMADTSDTANTSTQQGQNEAFEQTDNQAAPNPENSDYSHDVMDSIRELVISWEKRYENEDEVVVTLTTEEMAALRKYIYTYIPTAVYGDHFIHWYEWSYKGLVIRVYATEIYGLKSSEFPYRYTDAYLYIDEEPRKPGVITSSSAVSDDVATKLRLTNDINIDEAGDSIDGNGDRIEDWLFTESSISEWLAGNQLVRHELPENVSMSNMWSS